MIPKSHIGSLVPWKHCELWMYSCACLLEHSVIAYMINTNPTYHTCFTHWLSRRVLNLEVPDFSLRQLLLPFQGGTSFVDLLCFCSDLCLLCLCASVYMCFLVTCWERADLLALVCGVFCEFVTFPLVSWVRCGT